MAVTEGGFCSTEEWLHAHSHWHWIVFHPISHPHLDVPEVVAPHQKFLGTSPPLEVCKTINLWLYLPIGLLEMSLFFPPFLTPGLGSHYICYLFGVLLTPLERKEYVGAKDGGSDVIFPRVLNLMSKWMMFKVGLGFS